MDQRDQYRVDIGGSSVLQVGLVAAGGVSIVGRIADISVRGVSLVLSAHRGPQEGGRALEMGEEVQLRFPSTLLNKPLTASARVKDRTEEGDSLRYGFEFTDPAQFEYRLWPAFRELFNRRRAVRVVPHDELPVEVMPGAARAVFGLLDISTLGLAVRVPIEAEPALRATDRIRLSFPLPGWQPPVDVEGIVRSRVLLPGADVRYGAEFDLQRASNPEGIRSAIGEYVMQRRRATTLHAKAA